MSAGFTRLPKSSPPPAPNPARRLLGVVKKTFPVIHRDRPVASKPRRQTRPADHHPARRVRNDASTARDTPPPLPSARMESSSRQTARNADARHSAPAETSTTAGPHAWRSPLGLAHRIEKPTSPRSSTAPSISTNASPLPAPRRFPKPPRARQPRKPCRHPWANARGNPRETPPSREATGVFRNTQSETKTRGRCPPAKAQRPTTASRATPRFPDETNGGGPPRGTTLPPAGVHRHRLNTPAEPWSVKAESLLPSNRSQCSARIGTSVPGPIRPRGRCSSSRFSRYDRRLCREGRRPRRLPTRRRRGACHRRRRFFDPGRKCGLQLRGV